MAPWEGGGREESFDSWRSALSCPGGCGPLALPNFDVHQEKLFHSLTLQI